MKAMALGLLAAALTVTSALAGEIVKGKTCDYDPHGFVDDPTAVQGMMYTCDQDDWDMGGRPSNSSAKVVILGIGPPPYVDPFCKRGREHQVLIHRPGVPDRGFGVSGAEWVFPRFLNCP